MPGIVNQLAGNISWNNGTHSVDKVSWKKAMERMDWQQSQHVTLVGPTGTGKTELITELLHFRQHVVFLGTKNKDSTQDKLASMGFKIIPDAAQIEPDIHNKYIVKPGHGKLKDADKIKAHHKAVFKATLMRCYRQGGWTVVLDELRYVCGYLGLNDEMLVLWLQGRSEDITVISGTQRPRHVPLEAYDQPDHLFFFRDADDGNVSREAEIVGTCKEVVETTVPHLANHDVLYLNTRRNEYFVTNTRS